MSKCLRTFVWFCVYNYVSCPCPIKCCLISTLPYQCFQDGVVHTFDTQKPGSHNSSIIITWELARNPEFYILTLTYWIKICILTRYPKWLVKFENQGSTLTCHFKLTHINLFNYLGSVPVLHHTLLWDTWIYCWFLPCELAFFLQCVVPQVSEILLFFMHVCLIHQLGIPVAFNIQIHVIYISALPSQNPIPHFYLFYSAVLCWLSQLCGS